MKRLWWGLVVVVAASAAGCREKATAPARLEHVPAELAPRVAEANRAMDELGKTLAGRLKAALAQGPEHAVEVCSKQAQALTREVAARHELELGRSSHRLRNPANEGPEWVATYLADSAGRKAAGLEPAVYDLGDSVGVVRPIAMQSLCVGCHGPRESLTPELRQRIARAYPDDRAVGFAVGDLRGVFWAKLPKRR